MINLKMKLRKNPTYNSIKKIKMLSNKFNKKGQNLYIENYKTLFE